MEQKGLPDIPGCQESQERLGLLAAWDLSEGKDHKVCLAQRASPGLEASLVQRDLQDHRVQRVRLDCPGRRDLEEGRRLQALLEFLELLVSKENREFGAKREKQAIGVKKARKVNRKMDLSVIPDQSAHMDPKVIRVSRASRDYMENPALLGSADRRQIEVNPDHVALGDTRANSGQQEKTESAVQKESLEFLVFLAK